LKSVLISGSSSGLGRSLALVFARNEFNVILHGRDEERLELVRRMILIRRQMSRSEIECDVIRGDITSKDILDELFRAAEKRNLNILINNAGIHAHKRFQDMNEDEVQNIIQTNLIAPLQLILKIYPLFVKKKSGVIVNINSIAGKYPNEMEAVYCASKYGLRGFSEAFQYEADKDNIRIINIYPGAMKTPMSKSRINHKKLITPSEMADLVYKIVLGEAIEENRSMRVAEIELRRKNF
jgi:short-subunit dehydrogenase